MSLAVSAEQQAAGRREEAVSTARPLRPLSLGGPITGPSYFRGIRSNVGISSLSYFGLSAWGYFCEGIGW